MPGHQKEQHGERPLTAHLALPLLARELFTQIKPNPGYCRLITDIILGDIDNTLGEVKIAADLTPPQRRILLRSAGRLVIAALLMGQTCGYTPQDVLSSAARFAAGQKMESRAAKASGKGKGQDDATQ